MPLWSKTSRAVVVDFCFREGIYCSSHDGNHGNSASPLHLDRWGIIYSMFQFVVYSRYCVAVCVCTRIRAWRGDDLSSWHLFVFLQNWLKIVTFILWNLPIVKGTISGLGISNTLPETYVNSQITCANKCLILVARNLIVHPRCLSGLDVEHDFFMKHSPDWTLWSWPWRSRVRLLIQ